MKSAAPTRAHGAMLFAALLLLAAGACSAAPVQAPAASALTAVRPAVKPAMKPALPASTDGPTRATARPDGPAPEAQQTTPQMAASQETSTPTPAALRSQTTASRTASPVSGTQQPSNSMRLGASTNGWPIEAYRFGRGPLRLVLIGGIHGGYEWNTILLAYQAIDYFTAHPEQVPKGISVWIIPAANPDGQAVVTGGAGRFSSNQVAKDTVPGRLNGNGVDLNRNWDCGWKPAAVWRQTPVSPGEKPFSEVENRLLRDFLTQPPASAVVFWHSANNAVYAGGCGKRFAPADALGQAYARAAQYPFRLSFDAYAVSGDAIDWLAQQKIPGIEVELSDHSGTEWERNLKGIQALLAALEKGTVQ